MPRYLRKTRASPVTYSDLVHFAFYESQKSKNFGPNPISVRFLNMKVETYAKETGKALRGKYWARYCEPIIEAGVSGRLRMEYFVEPTWAMLSWFRGKGGGGRYSNTKAHADNPDIEDLRERLRLVCQHLRTTMAPTRKKTKFQLLKENNELRNQLWGARSPPPSVWSDASSSDNGEVKMDVYADSGKLAPYYPG
ncbi:hypothetical protein EW026_g2617 [Hermanssonia centrifuga]|uniref:Uncharacterized protein n=1 Tax=Hermanssonia centrifuga TaxID=98765 RepID=A0A4S4KNP7_9APHY|nr:hypothetical protein EW026_g2617 [Hermanssonia centrifuga]